MIKILLHERNGNVDDRVLKLTKEQYDFLLFLQDEEVIDDCNFEFVNLDGLEELSFGEEK